MNDERNLYMYVYRMLLTNIYNGTYKYREKLPSIAILCEQFHVGRNTLRYALLKLQEDEYVSLQKGTQATVKFNVEGRNLSLTYRQEIINSRQMTHDVYQTMILIVPDLLMTCFQAGAVDYPMIKQLTSKFNETYIHNETQLIQAMYHIYVSVFKAHGNPIMMDLVDTLLSYSYQPMTSQLHSQSQFKHNINGIRRTMNDVLNFAHTGQENIANKIIVFVIKLHARSSMRYINTLCADLTLDTSTQFVWVCNRNSEYLYMKVVLGIIIDIANTTYVIGDVLPSIAQFATSYDVSQRTIRKALDILREYHFVEIINGLGTIVTSDHLESIETFLYTTEVRDGLKSYKDALELFHILFMNIAYDIVEHASQDERTIIADALEHQYRPTFLPIADFVFQRTNPCLYIIFEELVKTLKWGILANMLETPTAINLKQLRMNIILSLRIGKTKEIIDACDRVICEDKRHIHSILECVAT